MSKIINKIKYHLFTGCLILLMCQTSSLNATHIVGGDISYNCLGNDQYELTLTVRRDCENAAEDADFDEPATISVFELNGGLLTFVGDNGRFLIPSVSRTIIANENIFDCSVLSGIVCVEETVYRDTVELLYNKNGYTLAYQRCCRNSIISNIQNPLETGATYYVNIPADVLEICNAQPVFIQWPDVNICANEDLSFNHSAVDPDGDLLIYKLCSPSIGATIDNPNPIVASNPPYGTVEWESSYDVNNMLGGNSGLRINANTGEITARPTMVGTYLIGICVEEYRNGEKISEVRRDFEYTVTVCGEKFDIGFNVLDNNCDGDTQVTFENTTQGADSFLWQIKDSNGNIIFTSADQDLIYDFPAFGTYSVLLEATRNSDGCVLSKQETVTIGTSDIEADFTASILSCVGGNTIELLDLSSDTFGTSVPVSWEWTVNGSSAPNSNPSSYDIGNAQSVTIMLMVTFNSGCSATVTKTIEASELIPSVDFTYSLDGCGTDSYDILFDALSTSTSAITDVSWMITDINGTQIGETDPYSATVSNQGVTVDLEATFANGCTAQIERELTAEDLSPDFMIINNAGDSDCLQVNEIQEVIFGAGISDPFINSIIVSYAWIVNGELFSTPEVTVDVMQGDVVNLSLIVTYENGCIVMATEEFDANFAPQLIINEDLDCENINGPTITLMDQTVFTGNASYTWNIDQVQASTNNTLEFVVGPVGNQVDLIVEFDNGCVSTYSQFFPGAGTPSYEVDVISCDGDSILVSIADNSSGATSVSWEINDNGVITTYTGSDVEISFDSDEIIVTQTVFFEIGCLLTETTTLNKNDILPGLGEPELGYTIIPIECFADSGSFLFTGMSIVPDCVSIISQVWVINGVTCTGSPIIKTLPLGTDIDFSYTVTFSDGTILSTSGDADPDNDSINTNDLVEQIDIEIVDNSTVNCFDSLDLSILNAVVGVGYEWSTDPEFINIIGTGTDLISVGGDLFTGTIYVQTIENIGPCLYGQGSIAIESDAIDLSFDMPFIVCPGDTSIFEVINNNSDQTITYEWKGGNGQLIDGVDTNNPLIGIGEDATEDFFFVLCTSNNLGCSSIDTINFEIRDNEQLEPFLFEPDSCGSLTINFDEVPNNLGGNAFWDFGDGNMDTGSMVSNTYDQPGVYTVTLSDSSLVCSKLPVMIDVNVPNLVIEILGSDTLLYESNTEVDILAETTADNQDITWCLEDGTNLGTGNPLENFVPGMDTVLVIAKVIDEYGCEESDSVILVLDDDIDAEDCLESVTITGPIPSVVCVNEDFQLNLLMDEDCGLDDFNYDWGPTDCIVSGNGTPNVMVSAAESKTIMVIVTHIESGIDSMFFYELEVSNPQVDDVSVPEINIDANGQPFVCLGQSIVLSVSPEDPNCNYTWSNGQTGPEIELTPEETITISVVCDDHFGCSSEESSVTILVVLPECNESDIYLPNAFSPNGDSANDVLFVRSKFIQEMELSITNRWGEQVFLSKDQSIGWDGTYKGKALAPDVFAYYVKVTCITGGEYIQAGNVSIIK